MSYHLKVKGLAGLHIGQHVTIKTQNTEASGILQGFQHDTDIIHDGSISGESWALGQTRASITLLPCQRIVATMDDEVIVHGYDKPESNFQSTALQIINDNPEVFHGTGD